MTAPGLGAFLLRVAFVATQDMHEEAPRGVRNEGIIESFARTTDEVISLEEFKTLLDSGKRLKIKFGADVTASFLHLGHAVNLWMMRELQERGHKVQFLIGDFTTRIGDPTGRDTTRGVPTRDEAEENARAFLAQIGRVLITDDPELFEVRRNSEWYASMPLAEFFDLLGQLTVARLSSRDMFKRRLEEGEEIWTHELVYPVLQGWDSVMLESDLTIVGSDQLFNEMMGRFFQQRRGMKPQVVLTTKITAGLDGKHKQSKTFGNCIAMDDDARTMFGKVMSLPDDLIVPWFSVYTTVSEKRVVEIDAALRAEAVNPRDAKRELATAIVLRWHGAEHAMTEAAWFDETFSKRGFPADAPIVRLTPGVWTALELCAAAAPESSRSELRRLLSQGAAELDGGKLLASDTPVRLDSVNVRELRIGKRSFFRIAADRREGDGPRSGGGMDGPPGFGY